MYFIKQDNKITPTKEGEKALQDLGMTFERFIKAVKNNENPNSRWPANIICTDDALNDGVMTKSGKAGIRTSDGFNANAYGKGMGIKKGQENGEFGDSGSKSRYFSIDVWAEKHGLLQFPKASKRERNEGLGVVEERNKRMRGEAFGEGSAITEHSERKGNNHPTVKPIHLMAWLIRLVSKEGDTVLDPFMGSGTTGIACIKLGRNFIGIEKSSEYLEIAKNRIESEHRLCQGKLPF